ncbi:MAG TPA: major capsid protein [Xylella sp.]
MRSCFTRGAVFFSLLTGSALVMAADSSPSFDVGAVTSAFSSLVTMIGLVGAAKISPAVISVGWKWIKGSVFS